MLQLKLAVSPNEEPETLTSPLEGAERGVQVIATGREEGAIATSSTVTNVSSPFAGSHTSYVTMSSQFSKSVKVRHHSSSL